MLENSSAIAQNSDDIAIDEIDYKTDEARRHIELLHRDIKGKICIAMINEKYKQRFYIPSTVIKNIAGYAGQENIFVTQNTFFKNSRKIEDIKNLCALYMDIDYYKKGLTKEQVLWNLEQDYYNIRIPVPSLEIDSGNGLYLIWLIKPVPVKALPLWNFTQNYFFQELSVFGADRQAMDASRILRMCGTINTKVNTTVKIERNNNYIYTINEIQEQYLPEIQKQKKKGKTNNNDVAHLYNTYTLHYERFTDLKRLVGLRKGNMIGHREQVLFLYRYWQCLFVNDAETALQETLELNNRFTYPLQENEVKRATRSAERAFESGKIRYKYKNNTIVDMLEITEDEQKHMNTLIAKNEKYKRNNVKRRENRRNDKGYTNREEAKMQNIEKIKELIRDNPLIKQSEIAENLGLSKQMISLYFKEKHKWNNIAKVK